jgi:methylamine dehydrogenase heavy chain
VCKKNWMRAWWVCGVALVAATLQAQVAPEKTGQVERLPSPPQPHWVFATDLVLERTSVVDVQRGLFLGSVPGGYGTFQPLFSRRRPEIYVPATYYSRRTRGERTDVLEIYDTQTLGFVAEIPIPPKRALNRIALNHVALSDDERFVAVFNWTTGTSLSIVDVERRRFVAEIDTPGCSLAYAAGPRRFFSLCPDGAAFVLELDDDGNERRRTRTQPFFDPRKDPVTEKAVRAGSVWYFVSFEGVVHPVDVSGPELRFLPTWQLTDEADRRASWRTGGNQHLAAHERLGRLYVLMHQGEKDTHKEPGSEVWVYDLASAKRLQRIPLRFPGATIYGFAIEPDASWRWPLPWIWERVLDRWIPPLVTAITVSQDSAPLLVTACEYAGALGIYDARTGEFLRRVQPIGWTTDLLFAPYLGEGS